MATWCPRGCKIRGKFLGGIVVSRRKEDLSGLDLSFVLTGAYSRAMEFMNVRFWTSTLCILDVSHTILRKETSNQIIVLK